MKPRTTANQITAIFITQHRPKLIFMNYKRIDTEDRAEGITIDNNDYATYVRISSKGGDGYLCKPLKP